VALDREEGINNGQPSLHAGCMDALKICAGETILHIGAGTGYYTAILAELTGLSGTVYAYEINDELCKRAAENLAVRSNIRVQGCSGTVGTLPDCDVIYVNAGVTGPPAAWLDALGSHGRVIFPLTSTLGTGQMLLLERFDEVCFSARLTGAVGFIPCIGARDEVAAFKLADAFAEGGARDVKSLHRGNSPDETCWFDGDSWWLSTSPVE
jgi:protein-L-isoaspartate(D-aspartate) O-methyltransferase